MRLAMVELPAKHNKINEADATRVPPWSAPAGFFGKQPQALGPGYPRDRARGPKIASAPGLFQDGAMPRPLALVSFNLLEGLRPLGQGAAERRSLDRQRRQAAIALVRELNPDILVLNEALFCRAHAGRTVDYGALFAFPQQAAALYDGAWGNAILSQHPIARSGEMRIYNRGGLTALISTPLGPLTVASYHPHPLRSPENKARDFASMVARLEGPLIVCGDFNAINPQDAIDRAQLIA